MAKRITLVVPNKHRPIWAGFIFITRLSMLGFGPAVAEGLSDHTAAGWRWCFYLGIIVSGTSNPKIMFWTKSCAAVTVILRFFCYHPPQFELLHKNRSKWEQIKRMDFVGMILFTGGLVLFLIGLNWGGSQYPWKSAHVITTTIVGFLSLVAFVVYDSYHRGDPLLPMHLFKSRGFGPMIASASVGSCVYYSMVILWPQQIAYLFPGTKLHSALLAVSLPCSSLEGRES